MRINKYISSTGYCSRRKAEEIITEGRVRVNGELANINTVIDENIDVVTIDGKKIEVMEEKIYLLLNKPVGITCTTERHIKGNIIDYVNYPKRIFPVGRLDKDSHGLILLTNDGDIVNKALREENNHSKEYLVQVDKPILPSFIQKMKAGVEIYNPVQHEMVKTKKCKVSPAGKRSFKIVLTQGYNRQIRRMCKACGYKVIDLERIRFMNLQDEKLEMGKWRKLTSKEIEDLYKECEIKG